MVEDIRALDLPMGSEAHKTVDTALKFQLSGHPACQPLGTEVPSQYGQAPFGAYRSMVQEWQKHPPYARNAP